MKVLVVSDPHLVPAGTVRGADPRRGLAAVLAHAGARDRVVATGDLANGRWPESYAILRDMLGTDALLVGGNHDRREALDRAFPDRPRVVDAGAWRLIGLESAVPRRQHGRLGAAQLAWLDGVLAERRPTVIFLHHPPVSVGTWWMDAIGLRDAAALGRVAAGRAAAIFHGHAHMANEGRLGDIPVYGTPSTLFQFVPGSLLPRRGPAVPGYRVLELGDSLATRVCMLGQGPAAE